MRTLAPVLKDPVLRAAAALIFLFGAVISSFGPYVSVLAVTRFGLGDGGYAAVLVASTLVSVTASVWVGIRADQTANRRGMALGALGLLVAGLGILALRPGPLTFVLAHALILPLASTFFGQIFALARLAASTHPAEDRDAIMAVIRALFAAPFVVVLPLWSVAFRQGIDILWVYPAGLALAGMMLALTLAYWPRDGATAWQDPPSGLSFRAALAELADPALAGRVLALGAVNNAMTIYVALTALILVPAIGRGPADVALYVGLVAGLEVPVMLALPVLFRGAERTRMILWGTALYVVHVALMPVLAAGPALWLLVLPAAVGGAVVLTVPIAYLQDLLAARPGTGASLLALQRLVGDVIAALCFACGTLLAGYGLVALLSTGVALAGAAALVWADRGRRFSAS
jgi:MFS transporter, SET family, sugar efflux transporter